MTVSYFGLQYTNIETITICIFGINQLVNQMLICVNDHNNCVIQIEYFTLCLQHMELSCSRCSVLYVETTTVFILDITQFGFKYPFCTSKLAVTLC